MTALTQADLNATGWHTVLYLHSMCHIRAGTNVSYSKATGNLTICCKKCDRLLTEIAVAPGGTRQ